MPDPVSIQQLVADVSLASISFIELGAARDPSGAVPDGGEASVEPVHRLQTAFQDDLQGFRVRVRTEIELPIGSIVVDVAAEYSLDTVAGSSIDQALLLEFVNEVAVMHLVPYIREGLADITRRVFGAGLLMPIMQRGEMNFDLADDEAVEAQA